MTRVVHIRNVMAPTVGAQVATDAVEGRTVSEVIEAQGWRLSPRTVLVRNGGLVKRADWDSSPLAANDDIALVAIPAGRQGGSGQIASQIVTVVVLAVLTIYDYGLTAPELAAAIAAISVGSALVQSIVFKPATKTPFDPNSGPQASPNYSLQTQTNQVRLGGAIPEVFGQHKVNCDLISQPYVDYTDNEQTIYELFAVGVGDYQIDEIGVAKNPVWTSGGGDTGSYPGLVYEVVTPGSAVTLFPDNVSTSAEVSAIELVGTNEVGYAVSGPFVANASGTVTTQIAVDIAAPGGLFTVNTSTGALQSAIVYYLFEAQEIDDAGAPIGSYFTLASGRLYMATRDAVRQTITTTVPAGRYRVRGARTNAKGDNQTSDTFYWFGMRAFLPSTRVYGDMTIIAVKAKATDHLNGTTAQQFYTIVTRKLPTYNTGTHTFGAAAATRKLADAVAYLCRSSNNGQMADSSIDLDRLYALQTTWTARGDNFDAVMDTRGTFWDQLQTMLRVGRSIPIIAGAVVTFVRDEPKTAYRCAFTPRNMIADTFANDYRVYATQEAPDAVVVDFFDSRNWAPNSVFCSFGDSVTEEGDAPHIAFFGITDRDHAWREGMYALADDRYRRVSANFDTELDGRVCFKGDLVKVSHWSADWGASFQVLSLAVDIVGHPETPLLTLSDPWSVPAGHGGDTIMATITTPDGQVYGPVTATLVNDGSTTRYATIRLTSVATIALGNYAGIAIASWGIWSNVQKERPRCMLGVATLVPQSMLVQSVRPQAGGRVSITAVIEDARVHAADDDDPPDDTAPPETPVADDLTITGLNLDVILRANRYVVGVTVRGAKDAVSFDAQWRWIDAEDYGPIVSEPSRTFSFDAENGALIVQVRAVGRSGVGNWFSATTSTASTLAPNLIVLGEAIATLRNVQILIDQFSEIAIGLTYKQEIVLPGLIGGVSASVTREANLRANADSAMADLVEIAQATADNATATALIRWIAAAGPPGVVARLALESRATLGDAYTQAGIYIDAVIIGMDLQSQITLDADTVWIKTPADRVILSDGGITTALLAENAATNLSFAIGSDVSSLINDTDYHDLVTVTLDCEGEPILINPSVLLRNDDNTTHGIFIRLTYGGSPGLGTRVWPVTADSDGAFQLRQSDGQTVTPTISHEPGAGTITYRYQYKKGDSVNIKCLSPTMQAIEVKR